MKILELKLNAQGKALAYGKLELEGCYETSFRIFDGQYGMWVSVGHNYKNPKTDKWVSSLWTNKNDKSKAIEGEILKAYEEKMKSEGQRLDDLHSAVADENVRAAESVVPSVQNFTADDIPF